MVVIVRNSSGSDIWCRTLRSYMYSVGHRESITFHLREADNCVIILSKHGLFIGNICDGRVVAVKPGNVVRYKDANTMRIVDGQFFNSVRAKSIIRLDISPDTVSRKVVDLGGRMQIS
ncbi:hypothetical protein GQ54DRAFT_297902 [Martensiomyces pterosporus]|nr:hypothetical protein GQ54DRAFT_297902 [Martensiomyces pterosporus]